MFQPYCRSLLCSLVVLLSVAALSTDAEGGDKSTASRPTDFQRSVSPGTSETLAFQGAILAIPAGALEREVTISIHSLRSSELPGFDPGMDNVTVGGQGYRFGPNGLKFSRPAVITLPYDPLLIPPGLTEQDIRTFYYDEATARWIVLQRLDLDRERSVVVSVTDHFTNFINGTLTLPDYPDVVSFNPTLIEDIKAADPAAQINLIQPPRANNLGTAQLSYPMQIPPGRNGFQPNIVLAYNSGGGGKSWTGERWNLPVQTIRVHTSAGVPRYDESFETETYTKDGELLTPLAHRGPLQSRTAEKTFHTRTEGQFTKITRHGDRPDNYSWEAVSKNGLRYIYGIDADSRLVDAQGNVFLWTLHEIRDTQDNFIRYHYVHVADTGVENGTVLGSELYPQKITYTGQGSQEGPYAITFTRDRELGESRRPDVVIDCRGGFKRVTADLLRRIDVTLNGELVRRYELTYKEGAFRKTLLSDIRQYGEDGTTEFNRHTFDYYDEARDEAGDYLGFDPAETWDTGTDDVDHVSFPISGDAGDPSALGGSISDIGDNIGGHIYVGFNLSEPTKSGSIGFKIGYNRSRTNAVLGLLDIDGNNLPDKVFKSESGDTFFYRPNQSGPRGSTVFGPLKSLPTLPAIAQERSTTTSFGAEQYIILSTIFNLANTFTRGTAYFSDANGDGLPDLVRRGDVFFNYLDANGTPTFSLDSGLTPVPVGPGAVDITELIEDYEDIYQENIDRYPLHDTLRSKLVSFDGQIQITGDVALIEDTSPQAQEYETADGVRVAIQHNGAELWSTAIAANDFDPKTPLGVDSISVQKGDRIYFRVQSVFDGAFDQVAWDPEITYLNVPTVSDVNNLDPYRYKASEDFVLAGRRGIFAQMPFNGTVRLTGDLHKDGITTDDITLSVVKNNATVIKQTLAWDQTGSIALSEDISVAQQDRIELRIRVDSPVDLSLLQWVPSLFYIDSPDVDVIQDDQGNYLIQLNPPYDIDMYPDNNLTDAQEAWTATQTGTLTVVTQLSTFPGDSATNGEVTFTVKRPRELVDKQAITITNGAAQNVEFDIDVTQGENLYFDYSSSDPELKARLSSKKVVVVYGDPDVDPTIAVPSPIHSAVFPGLFAQPYRGWASAGYNGNRDAALLPIDESQLVFTPDYNLQTARVYLFNPFPAEGFWRGPDDLGWVRADTMSASRLGLDFIDVPRPDDFAGGRAVDRLSRTRQTALSLPILGSNSEGESYGQLDYLDMNGDLFPDIVGNGRIQYTTLVGGLEANNRPSGLGKIRRSENEAENMSIGGNPATFKANSQGCVDTDEGSGKENNTGSQMVTLGFLGSLSNGESDVRHDLIDVNGDGLLDQIRRSGSQLLVRFNLGYGFAPAEPWGNAAITAGESEGQSVGVSLGYNDDIYGFAGGLSLSGNESTIDETLVDINGDGLTDRVRRNGSSLLVSFNTGNGFASAITWPGTVEQEITTGRTTGLGGGVYFTIGIGPLCTAACYIIINPGAEAGIGSMARREVALIDVDGDGYVDHASSDSDSSLTVARNPTGRTNLLRSVSGPLGRRIDIEFISDGNTFEHPQRRWVLSKTTVFDGHPGDGVDTSVTTYRYEDGRYNRLEREFYGYRKVVVEHRDASDGEALYRTITREYLNDSSYTKGLIEREVLADASGALFVETENTIILRDIHTGDAPADSQSTTATLFPMLIRVDERFYEGNPDPGKITYKTYEYDELGNVTRFFDAGDIGAQDDVEAFVIYSSETPTCEDNHIVGMPISIEVYGNGTLMRKREATIDCSTGTLMQMRRFLESGQAAVSDLTYYPNGSIESVTGPVNHAGQRYSRTLGYDPVAETHVVSIIDSFGYQTSMTHNYKYGKAESITDINGNPILYEYDIFGRLTNVIGPIEVENGDDFTIRFEYHHDAPVPWALTQHFDRYRDPDDPVETVLFIDGLKRILQTKTDSTIHTGPNSDPQDVMTVTGRVTFDLVGRTIEQFYPMIEPLGTQGVFNTAYDTVQPTRMAYDRRDRNTSTINPDNTSVLVSYGFGLDRNGQTQFATTITDPEGNTRISYRNARDLVVAVKEFNHGQPLWTSFTYDPLGQVADVIDDPGNTGHITHDNFGRRTSLHYPDTNETVIVRDLAGNAIQKITANLQAEDKFIAYEYDHNRLVGITYPNNPENDVRYEYGAPGAPDNRAGRISSTIDRSGSEDLFYNTLGAITKQIRTVPFHPGDGLDDPPHTLTYTTHYTYDSFGRLQCMVHPDGEEIANEFDTGGRLRAVSGEKTNRQFAYLDRLEYNKFGRWAFTQYGNGVTGRYEYDLLNQRLLNQKTERSQGELVQNLFYNYDNIGNVLQLVNDRPVPPPSELGGPTQLTFGYDDLYQLTDADGSYEFEPGKRSVFTSSLAYNEINNIISKEQSHDIIEPGDPSIPQMNTTYDFTYLYEGPQPHATTHVDERAYSYDLNGNQIGWEHDQNGTHREIAWDEENRVKSISDNGKTTRFVYNADGTRIRKWGPRGETLYVNDFFTIRNRRIASKHIFAGMTRICTKIERPAFGSGGGPPNASGRVPRRYFYHTDQLGSSNYITDNNGDIYEHLEYFPFGEIWVDERSETVRLPYLFTGKEFDEETGLYYFGARYYDPRTSVWQSADPIGFASGDSNLYRYASNNPVGRIDQSGLQDAAVTTRRKRATIFRNDVIGGTDEKLTQSNRLPFIPGGMLYIWTPPKNPNVSGQFYFSHAEYVRNIPGPSFGAGTSSRIVAGVGFTSREPGKTVQDEFHDIIGSDRLAWDNVLRMKTFRLGYYAAAGPAEIGVEHSNLWGTLATVSVGDPDIGYVEYSRVLRGSRHFDQVSDQFRVGISVGFVANPILDATLNPIFEDIGLGSLDLSFIYIHYESPYLKGDDPTLSFSFENTTPIGSAIGTVTDAFNAYAIAKVLVNP